MGLFILFFLIWVIFNGQLTAEIGLLGIAVAAVIYIFICRFMDWSPKKEIIIVRYGLFMIAYICVLIWEILKANIATIRIIFSVKKIREPVLVTFKTDIKSQVFRVILANSITLTPGTITVSLEGDTYVVHALDKDFAEGIEDSVFVRMLKKAECAGEGSE